MNDQPNKAQVGGNYDLSEKGSERSSEEGTKIAREQESDDINEATNLGHVSTQHGDSDGENKVATSLDDE